MAERGIHSTTTVIIAGIASLLIGAGVGYGVAANKFGAEIAKITEEANGKIAAANATITQANSRIAEQSRTEQALALRDLPLRVAFRKALLGGGSVAVLTNFGGSELAIKVVATSPASNQSQQWRIVLEPNRAQEIGSHQGWRWANGDVLEASGEGYRPARFNLSN